MNKRDEHVQGVIWDLDGTLVDTSALHFAAWQQVAQERGQPFSLDDFSRTFGRRNPEILGILFGDGLDAEIIDHLGNHKEELFRAAVIKQGVTLLPGAADMMKQLHDAGFKQAIGSSAPKANIELLTEVAGLSQYLQAIVAMEDTQRGKPDPEVFLKAAGKLAVLPGWCVVVEDAVFGVQAAKAASMACIAIRGGGHSTTDALREAKADIVVEWLTELTFQQFTRLTR